MRNRGVVQRALMPQAVDPDPDPGVVDYGQMQEAFVAALNQNWNQAKE